MNVKLIEPVTRLTEAITNNTLDYVFEPDIAVVNFTQFGKFFHMYVMMYIYINVV